MILTNSRYFKACLFVVCILLLSACDKNEDEIPYAHVNIYLNLNLPSYYALNTVGGWEYITAEKPSKGIIVYRNPLDYFLAFERTCPYDPFIPEARIEVEPTFVTAICPNCNTTYILFDGSPIDGPGKRSLRSYRTTFNNNMLHIFN